MKELLGTLIILNGGISLGNIFNYVYVYYWFRIFDIIFKGKGERGVSFVV